MSIIQNNASVIGNTIQGFKIVGGNNFVWSQDECIKIFSGVHTPNLDVADTVVSQNAANLLFLVQWAKAAGGNGTNSANRPNAYTVNGEVTDTVYTSNAAAPTGSPTLQDAIDAAQAANLLRSVDIDAAELATMNLPNIYFEDGSTLEIEQDGSVSIADEPGECPEGSPAPRP